MIFINHVYCKPQNTAIKYTKSNIIKQYFKILEFKSISILFWIFIGICWTIFKLEYGGGGNSFAIVYGGDCGGNGCGVDGSSVSSWSYLKIKEINKSSDLNNKKIPDKDSTVVTKVFIFFILSMNVFTSVKYKLFSFIFSFYYYNK